MTKPNPDDCRHFSRNRYGCCKPVENAVLTAQKEAFADAFSAFSAKVGKAGKAMQAEFQRLDDLYEASGEAYPGKEGELEWCETEAAESLQRPMDALETALGNLDDLQGALRENNARFW